MNIINIKVGDKFSTESKLLTKVGFEKYSGKSQKEYQIRELQRYLTYEKTGKISRGKETNEIIVTEIFDQAKEKIDNRKGKHNDNRKNNGGNNTSIIADYIYATLCDKLNYNMPIKGSMSGIVRQMKFFCDDYIDIYYNFDDCHFSLTDDDGNKVPYNSKQKEFFFNFCDEIMDSLKSRLKRIIDKLENVTINTYYQLAIPAVNKNGNAYMETEDITDETILKSIIEINDNLETLYGVLEPKDKWKIYHDKTKANKFHNQFVSEVQTKLKREDFTNCYKIIEIVPNENFECEDRLGFYYLNELNKAIFDLINKKIQKVMNKKESKWDSNSLNYVDMDKYRVEDITNELLNDCKDMISLTGAYIDDTGELHFDDEEQIKKDSAWISDDMIEKLNAPAAEYHSMAI